MCGDIVFLFDIPSTSQTFIFVPKVSSLNLPTFCPSNIPDFQLEIPGSIRPVGCLRKKD